jgi:hypothetical protein
VYVVADLELLVPEDEAAQVGLGRLQAIADRVNEAIARILADAEWDVADRRARRERWMGDHALLRYRPRKRTL